MSQLMNNCVASERVCKLCGSDDLVPRRLQCRECKRAEGRQDYYRHREKRLARMAVYQKTHRDEHAVRVRRWEAQNPEKRAARTAVNNAIRAGKLLRQPCQECGDANSQAHHTDYSQPLQVQWLCPTHHKQAHVQAA